MIAQFLGHATTATTRRYTHLKPDHLRDTVRALESVLRSGPISAPSRRTEIGPDEGLAASASIRVDSGTSGG